MVARPRRVARHGATAVLLLLAACSERQPSVGYPPLAGNGEFSVMSYNLSRFCRIDRDGDGQEDDFKPESEIQPLLDIITAARPDVLAVQEMGDASTLTMLQQRLKDSGLDYPFSDHLAGHRRDSQLGLLSRRPITASEPLTNFTYTIRGRTIPVQRGFQQVDLMMDQGVTVRVIHVHLKSKEFHEAGQTEMRRNEARLLATHIRRLQREQGNLPLILCGDFSDSGNSAALRELVSTEQADLHLLPLIDAWGDSWTYRARPEEANFQSSFIMVNRPLHPGWRMEKSGIIHDLRGSEASDHRPVLATFRVID